MFVRVFHGNSSARTGPHRSVDTEVLLINYKPSSAQTLYGAPYRRLSRVNYVCVCVCLYVFVVCMCVIFNACNVAFLMQAI